MAQTTGLAVGSATVAAGGSTALNLSMTASAGAQPDGIEWTVGYSPTDVSKISVTAGAAAISAGKTITCTTGTANITCLLYGMNSASISSGVVAQVAVNVSPATTNASTAIVIGGPVTADGTGSAIPTTASGGVITISRLPVVSSLACAPANFTSPGNASCTITLSGAAPAAGSLIALTSSNAQAAVPASLSIPAGSTSGTFTATVASPAASGGATISASAGGATKSAAIAFSPDLVSSLSCSETTVPSGSSTPCTITLVSAAPASGETVTLSSGNPAITLPATVAVAAGATTTTFTAAAAGVLSEQVWITASLNGSSTATTVQVSALQIQGSSSELAGSSNGSIVTPAVAPSGFTGALVVTGTGTARFGQVGNESGVSFLNCCSNTNTAHYKFTGAGLGSIFNVNQGQISFSLKSSYSFAQRQTTAAGKRYAFDVQDNVSAGHHLFYFMTEYSSNHLNFTYSLGGAAQIYYVPTGTEDTLYGNGVILQVKITWNGSTSNLYLNGTLVQTETYTMPTAAWTATSVFDLGATEYFTYGGYNSSDDLISAFTVGVPIQP